MFNLLPKDTVFYDLFEKLVQHVVASAKQLQQLTREFPRIEGSLQIIRNEEHAADDLAHQALDRLDRTFITPFDREDIHRLTSSLDDVLDFVNSAGVRLRLYRIDAPPPVAAELAGLIVQQAEELAKGVSLLEQNQRVLEHCVEVHRLENEADRVSRNAIAELFDNEKDPIQLIKMKELYEVLETATDKAEDAANVLEAVALKSA